MDLISLKWNDHNSSLITSLDHFKAVDSFVDVTLVCEGYTVKAHKIILSAGSNVLRRLLLANPANHPIIILAETKYETLRIIIDFLYKGKIDISRNDLAKVLQVATTFEMNDLKNLCEENLNKRVGSAPKLHASAQSDLVGSSPKKKRQRRQSSDSDVLIEATVVKKEISFEPCELEQTEVLPFNDTFSMTSQIESVEFHPQIADSRSVLETSIESSAGSDIAKKIQKDASTECDIQPLKELKCNSAPIKLRSSIVESTYTEISDDSESDTNYKPVYPTKRRRSRMWKYFTAVNENYAVCRICKRKLSYKTTVTNLAKHLIKIHRQFDPKHHPKLPEMPMFEEVDLNSVEEEADIQDEEDHLEYEAALAEGVPSTSTPCILKIT